VGGDRLAVGLHESGHYVVAGAMGFDAQGCSIDADGGGAMRYLRAVGDIANPAGRRKLVAVALAGMLAERRHYGREHAGRCALDHRRATDLLMLEPRERRARAQREAIGLAADALAARWGFVVALAEEMRDVGRWGR
jgi:hypothetical protein